MPAKTKLTIIDISLPYRFKSCPQWRCPPFSSLLKHIYNYNLRCYTVIWPSFLSFFLFYLPYLSFFLFYLSYLYNSSKIYYCFYNYIQSYFICNRLERTDSTNFSFTNWKRIICNCLLRFYFKTASIKTFITIQN